MSTIKNIDWGNHEILDTSMHFPSRIESLNWGWTAAHGMHVMLPLYTEPAGHTLASVLTARFRGRYKEIIIDDLPVALLEWSHTVTTIPFNLNNWTDISDGGWTFYICQQEDIPNEEKLSIQLDAIRKSFLQKRLIQHPKETQRHFEERVQLFKLDKIALRVPVWLVTWSKWVFVGSAIDEILTYPDIFKPGEDGAFDIFTPRKPNPMIPSEAQLTLEK